MSGASSASQHHKRVRHPDELFAMRKLSRFNNWVTRHLTLALGSIIGMWLSLVVPLVAFEVPSLLRVLGLVSSYWVQLWALFVLQRSANIADAKGKAKADADHEAMTSMHIDLDEILDLVRAVAGKEGRSRMKFGRLPNDPSRPRVRYTAHLRKSAAASAPGAVDFYSRVPAWGMLGNDQHGDCVFAANGHIVEQQTALGSGSEASVSLDDVLGEYARVGGFNPAEGPQDVNPTDKGSTIQLGLEDLRKNGLAGHRIAAFAEIDPASVSEVKAAVAEFGAVDVGCVITRAAITQFDTNEPWDVVADDGGSLGGHCVLLCGYDSDYAYLVSWGRVQRATWAWWSKYVEEAWAVISSDWAASGRDPEGLDLQSMGEEFAQLTGEPNPFQASSAPAAPASGATPAAPAVPSEAPSWFARFWEEFHQWLLSRI